MSEASTTEDFDATCERFLAQIESAHQTIEAAGSDKTHRKRLERARADLCREFAVHLHDHGRDEYRNADSHAWTLWVVEGNPSRNATDEARAWLETQNLFGWTGYAPQLCSAVRSALRQDKPVPAGYFGLHVEWTVHVYKCVRAQAD